MQRLNKIWPKIICLLVIFATCFNGLWSTNNFGYKPEIGARGQTEKGQFDSGLDRVDARLGKEIWVGDPLYGATFQTAVTAIGATPAILRVPAGTHSIAANLTLPTTLTLKPERGAIFAIADTKILTINGGFEAGLYLIFSYTGTGKVVFAAGSNQTIFPQWWGASPSASAAVNTTAIQASFTALADYTSWTLPPGTYTCNASLVIGATGTPTYGLTMDFKGKLLFDSCSGLDIRNVQRSNLRGIAVKRTAQAWDIGTTTTDFGVKFTLCRRSNIGLDFIEDFSYGFWLSGDTNANSYLTFNLGYIAECKYGLYVTSLNSGGWNNEFNYYGGEFTSNRFATTAYTNVSIANNTLTHPTAWPTTFVTGFAVYVAVSENSAGNLPAPLVLGGTYYIIKDSSTVIKLASSYANAMAGTPIDLTTQGDSTVYIGKAGSWAAYFAWASGGSPFDNHHWYGSDFEALHNGVYLAGYDHGMQMFLSHCRFEAVANWIEAAPRNLVWIQGATSMGRAEIARYCPRMIGTDGKSIVNITSNGYADLDSFLNYAMPKDKGGITFYNPFALDQVSNLQNIIQDYFCLRQGDGIKDYGNSPPYARWTYANLNKNFEGTAAPAVGASAAMTYAKNAVVWNSAPAAGAPMGWVCSKSGSITRAAITGTVSVTGTTMTVTTRGSSYYLFVGAFVLIDGVQHQLKACVTPDPGAAGAVWTLYANNLGGDVTGKAVVIDPPTWIPMVNLVAAPTAPSVPASTVEQANANAYPCRVSVTGGTVTAIAIGPAGATVATGATAGAFILQPGWCIKITYSVAPTWTWLGM